MSVFSEEDVKHIHEYRHNFRLMILKLALGELTLSLSEEKHFQAMISNFLAHPSLEFLNAPGTEVSDVYLGIQAHLDAECETTLKFAGDLSDETKEFIEMLDFSWAYVTKKHLAEKSIDEVFNKKDPS